MKQIFHATLLILVVLLFTAPHLALSAVSDTLVVYATPNSLDAVISADTVAGGAQAHKVYKLVSLDTTYLFAGAITAKSNLTVLGVLNPTTGRPPCIQPAELPDHSIPANLFVLTGQGTKGTFKNLYLLGIATNNSANNGGVAIQVSADSIRIAVDNTVFEEWLTFAIGYNGNWDKFFITNCKFRNMVEPNQWYIGEVLRNEWPGAAYTDSVVMRYNTIFCVNGYAAGTVTKYYESYFEFSHNSVVYTFKNPFFVFNVTNGKINNNLFYGAWAGAISKPEYPWWDELWNPEIGSIIDLDVLDSAKVAFWKPALPKLPSGIVDTAAEKLRTIEIKNNAYFFPATLTSFWTAWNDTAHDDSVYTISWMNARTTNMVTTDKLTWPGIVASGNQNVDPGFGASIPNVLTQSTNGLLAWFRLCRTNALTTTFWDYQKTQVGTAANWVPTWPLPETADMKYTNTSLKTGGLDGRPIGDPWWFNGTNGGPTGVAVQSAPLPKQFTLSEAYPNPFNPSTHIEYTLAKSGVTSLRVYNVLGQVVSTLVDNVNQAAGKYTVTVEMSRATSGVYFYVLEQGGNRIAHKMVLLK